MWREREKTGGKRRGRSTNRIAGYLAGRKQVHNPGFDVAEGNVETRANNTGLVDAPTQVHNNLSGSVVINDLELVDVSVLLHNLQKFHNDLGTRTDQDLTLPTLLSIGDGTEAISQNTHANHIY